MRARFDDSWAALREAVSVRRVDLSGGLVRRVGGVKWQDLPYIQDEVVVGELAELALVRRNIQRW